MARGPCLLALALAGLLAALPACDTQAPGQSPPGAGAGSPVGWLALRAAGPFLAGEEPVLSTRTKEGGDVSLALYRTADPVALVATLDDLGHPTSEGALRKALDDHSGELGLRPVRTWTATLEKGEGKLALGPVEPGLYLLEARAGRRVALLPLVVSDLSLIVKRSAEETLVWVVMARTGDPVAEAAVTLLGRDQEPRTLSTDAHGVVRADVRDVEALRVVAVAEDSVAVVDPIWVPPARRDRLVHVSTDRPLYRPGETVLFRGIARVVRGERMAAWQGTVGGVELVPSQGEPVPAAGPLPAMTDLGTFSGGIALPVEAALGDWRLVVTLDGRRYGAELRVEAFRRPEAEVLVAAEPAVALQGDPVAFTIAARYYAGGAVASAPVAWSVLRTSRVRPPWRSPQTEAFLGEAERAAATPVEIAKGEGSLDAEGRLAVRVPTERLDDDVSLVLVARVTDEAGRAVEGRGAARSLRSLVTVDLRTDREAYEAGEEIAVTVRVTDPDGRPVAAPVSVRSVIGEADRLLGQGSSDAGSGLFRMTVSASVPGPLRLVAVAMDSRERERSAGKSVWVTEEGLAPGYGGEGLSLVPDRETYAPGDMARLLVLLPASLGHAHLLVTVEGERLHTHRVELLREGSALLSIPIERAFGTAFRVGAAAVRDGRVFSGEARLLAPPVDRLLHVEVTPGAESYRPGGRGFVTVKVSDAAGLPAVAEVGIAGVDEALLALQGDLAPTLELFFHGVRPSRVRTFLSAAVTFYDATAPVGGTKQELAEEARMADGADQGLGGAGFRAPAGEVPGATRDPAASPAPTTGRGEAPEKKQDAEGGAEPPRARFAATALWAPHVLTGPDGTAVVPVTFPDDLTRWRFTAAAVDAATRAGSGEGRAVTTRPLRLTVAAPRFLTERDRIRVPVVLRSPGHAGEEATASVDVDPRLESTGETSWARTLGEDDRAAATLDLRAVGRGEVALVGRASLGNERDAMEARFPVKPHGVRRASVLATRLDGEKPWTGAIEVPADARPGSVQLRLSFEPTRLAAVWRALDSLVAYPHGCTEQTLHRFLPDLAARAAVGDLGLGGHPRAEELPRLVAAGVRRLIELQHEDSGWGWWKEDATDPGMTALVVRGLAEATVLGTSVPPEPLARGAAALARILERPDLDYPTRALGVAALHAAKALPDGLADRLFDDEARLRASPQTLALLLPVLRARGRDAEAMVLVREILARASRGEAGTHWGEANAERWQDDAVETTADVVAALAAEEELRPVVEDALRWLLARRDGAAWASTRSSASAVRAILAAARASPGPQGSAALRVRVDDGIVGQVRVTAEGGKGEPGTLELPPALLEPGAQRRLTLERAGDLPVDVTAVLDWQSTREDLPSLSSGIAVERTLHRLEAVDRGGRIVHERRDPAGTRVGDLLLLDVTIAPERPGEFLEIEIPYPAGAEPVPDDRTVDVEGERPSLPEGAHRELRDDAAWLFLRRADAGTLRLSVLLRVTHAGEFHVLPARAGLMYFPGVHGASAEARLAVEER